MPKYINVRVPYSRYKKDWKKMQRELAKEGMNLSIPESVTYYALMGYSKRKEAKV